MKRPAPPGLSRPDTENAPQRILVVRLSALGDVALSSSRVPESLRRAFPRAHIAGRVQPEFAGLLEGRPDLDEVLESAGQVLGGPLPPAVDGAGATPAPAAVPGPP